MAVTDEPESIKKSAEWSPIHPSRNPCPVPEICMTESSAGSAQVSGRSICKLAGVWVVSQAGKGELSVVRIIEILVDDARS